MFALTIIKEDEEMKRKQVRDGDQVSDTNYTYLVDDITRQVHCDYCKEKVNWMRGWNTYTYKTKEFCSYNCKMRYLKTTPPTKSQLAMIKKYETVGCVAFTGNCIKDADEYISREIFTYTYLQPKYAEQERLKNGEKKAPYQDDDFLVMRKKLKQLIDDRKYSLESILKVTNQSINTLTKFILGDAAHAVICKAKKRILDNEKDLIVKLWKYEGDERELTLRKAYQLYIYLKKYNISLESFVSKYDFYFSSILDWTWGRCSLGKKIEIEEAIAKEFKEHNICNIEDFDI